MSNIHNRIMACFSKMRSIGASTFIRGNINSMKYLADIFNENDIKYCFLGGAILWFYNYERFTEDIDILVSEESKDKFLELFIPGFRPRYKNSERSYIITSSNTPVDVIFTNDSTSIPSYDKFEELYESEIVDNVNINILSLKSMIEFKLNAGRTKDYLDVNELCNHNKLTEEYSLKLKPEYRELFRKYCK